MLGTSPGRVIRLDQFSLGGLGNCTTPGTPPCCGTPSIPCGTCSIPATGLTITLSGTYIPCTGGVHPYSFSWSFNYYSSASAWVTDCLNNGPFDPACFCVGTPYCKFRMTCTGSPLAPTMGASFYCASGQPPTSCPAPPTMGPSSLTEGYTYSSSLSTCSPLSLVFTIPSTSVLQGTPSCCSAGVCNCPSFTFTKITVTP